MTGLADHANSLIITKRSRPPVNYNVPNRRTSPSGEFGYWEQRNAGTQSPLRRGEPAPLHVPQFGYTARGNPLRSDPTLSEARGQKPHMRVSGKDPPPVGDSGARDAPLTILQ